MQLYYDWPHDKQRSEDRYRYDDIIEAMREPLRPILRYAHVDPDTGLETPVTHDGHFERERVKKEKGGGCLSLYSKRPLTFQYRELLYR
jgi:hypothetical protein